MPRSIFCFLIASLALPAAAAQPRDVKALFSQICAACHGQDGTGRSATGARLAGRNLADARWQTKQTDSQLVKSILNGKSGMPAFGAMLKEDEAQRLVDEVIRPMAAKKR